MFFVRPDFEVVTYLRKENIINPFINLALVRSIEKTKYSWYPDNEGLPAIKFNFGENDSAVWVYPKDNIDLRNKRLWDLLK